MIHQVLMYACVGGCSFFSFNSAPECQASIALYPGDSGTSTAEPIFAAGAYWHLADDLQLDTFLICNQSIMTQIRRTKPVHCRAQHKIHSIIPFGEKAFLSVTNCRQIIPFVYAVDRTHFFNVWFLGFNYFHICHPYVLTKHAFPRARKESVCWFCCMKLSFLPSSVLWNKRANKRETQVL